MFLRMHDVHTSSPLSCHDPRVAFEDLHVAATRMFSARQPHIVKGAEGLLLLYLLNRKAMSTPEVHPS